MKRKTDTAIKPAHAWLRKISISLVPGEMHPNLEPFCDNLVRYFQKLGHEIHDRPQNNTDLILTTKPFGEVIPWRKALIFHIRKRFNLNRIPTILSIIHISPEDLTNHLHQFAALLAKEIPDPQEYISMGLAPNAYRVLYEQGRRGGPMLAFERLVQAQSKSIRTLLVVGDHQPEKVYHFDLVGGHPVTEFTDEASFYTDIVQRVVTTMSTREIIDHQVVGDPIPYDRWAASTTPHKMEAAAQELGRREFFTDMVQISDIVQVPAVDEAIASQYSEGCFATWDPFLDGLLTTVTGSARPVDKGSITEDDLAIIIGVRADGLGALVREVQGKSNDPPSSEAVELIGIDEHLPRIRLPLQWGIENHVPVIRSKLHGHRGISAYKPELVEFVPLAQTYYDFPVTCATEAQAIGIIDAFQHCETMLNPDDPRKIAFTILPTHGSVIVEKWVYGKQPFELIWEYMDRGFLEVDNHVPQGSVFYRLEAAGKMQLQNSNPNP